VDQLAHLLDEVAAQDLNFFDKTLESHTLDYVATPHQVPRI
jgi:hypothetical protein